MEHSIDKITFISENGNPDKPNHLEASIDISTPNASVSLAACGKVVFSLGQDEIAPFCKELRKLTNN
jgi:hypothetical protein